VTSPLAVQVSEELIWEQVVAMFIEKAINGALRKRPFTGVSAQIEEPLRFRRVTLGHFSLIAMNRWMR